MAGIIKDGKTYASVNPSEYVSKSSIAKTIDENSTNEEVTGAKVSYSIKNTADASLSKINSHLTNSYKIVGVTFNRGAINAGNYIIEEISYTVPSGYYIVNFQVAHNGHFGIYIFTQYLSSINGDIKFTIGFANATQTNIEAQTDLILNVYLAKV